jgi:hypothetical protein
MKLTRNLFIPLVDANTMKEATGKTTSGTGYDWTRIDKSTIFDLAFNPQEETNGYIDSANDTTTVTSYQPELPQEIILDSSNPLYNLAFDFCMAFPLGSDAQVPCLLVYPDADGNTTKGMLWEEAIISPTDLNTVDGKLNFSLKLNGDAKTGTASVTDSKVTFTADGGTVTQSVD